MSAFVHSYSQSQARLMFVTTLGIDNFDDCTKMNAHFKKFTACPREGLIHEWKQASLALPLPLMSLNNSRLCSTHKHHSAPMGTSTTDKWLYMTTLYHGSAWVYLTLLHSAMALLDWTKLYHGSTWLYLTFATHYHGSVSFYLTLLYTLSWLW